LRQSREIENRLVGTAAFVPVAGMGGTSLADGGDGVPWASARNERYVPNRHNKGIQILYQWGKSGFV